MLKQIQHNQNNRDDTFFEKKLTSLKILIGKNHDSDAPLNYNELVTRFLTKIKNK